MRYTVLKKHGEEYVVALVPASEGLSDQAFADGYRVFLANITLEEVNDLGFDWDEAIPVKSEQHSGFDKVDPPGQKESAFNDSPVMDRKPRGFRPVY